MRIMRRAAAGLLVAVLGLAVAAGVELHRDGYHAYIIHTGSMTGTFDSGGIVIDKPIKASQLRVGEPITFLHSGESTGVVTHRIVGLANGTIQTKGDANKIRDTWNIRHDQVKGLVVHYVPYAGYVIYFLKHRTGDAAVATALLTMILLWDLFFVTAAHIDDPSAKRRKVELLDVAVPAITAPPTASYDLAFDQLRMGRAVGHAGHGQPA